MRWQPIETLPGNDEQVLFSSPAGMFLAPATLGREATREEKLEMYRRDGTWPHVQYTPTHWMPLPPPPHTGNT